MAIESRNRRRRRAAAARLRVRRHDGVRSVPAVRRFPQRQSGRLPRRVSVASASRDRDDHLRARRHGRARRQPRQPRQPRRRRRAVDDRRAAASCTRRCRKGDAPGRMHGFQLWANLPSSLKMTAPRYQDIAGRRHSRSRRRRRHARAGHLRRVLGQEGPVEGVAADPRYLDMSVPPGKTQDARGRNARATPSRTSSRARARFATRRRRSGVRTEDRSTAPTTRALPRREPGNRSLVLFDRGDEVVGAGGRAGDPLPARLGQADRGAGGLVRADRDEHRAGAAAGDERAAQRHVHITVSLTAAATLELQPAWSRRCRTASPIRCSKCVRAFTFLPGDLLSPLNEYRGTGRARIAWNSICIVAAGGSIVQLPCWR